jgi:organic radical activating enzyme
MNKTRRYPVVEIFESVQGEGYNTGREAVFLRFGGCDLNCPWGDTDWRTFEPLDADAIAARVSAFKTKALIVTGGEPFIQDDLGPLLGRFKDLGYWIAAETNGLTALRRTCGGDRLSVGVAQSPLRGPLRR